MHLTKSFAQALLPCIVACCTALAAPPGTTTDPVTQADPAVVSVQLNPHQNINAQLSFMEWRKRWIEARSETNMLSAQAARFSAQPAVLQPL